MDRPDEHELTRAVIELATQYGRYGYRRITALLRNGGWQVGKDRVQQIWEILSKVVDGVSSGGFLSDAIDEGHAIDDLDDQLSPVQCSPLFLRGQRQLEDHR